MKTPKTFLYPRIYFQAGVGEKAYAYYRNRIRIIWPNGKCQWACDENIGDGTWYQPCWSRKGMTSDEPDAFPFQTIGKCFSGNDAVICMNVYDIECGFEPALFLGEIRD